MQQTGKESVWADERHASELLEIWGQAAQARGGQEEKRFGQMKGTP